MTGHGAKFARKMEQAIAALLTRPSIEDAARVAGVGEKTIRRWMQEPQFKARYLQARGDSVRQSIARIQQATGAAGATILRLMTDPNVPSAVRLRAAESVFGLAVKGIELEDIEMRLAELERAAGQTKDGRRSR
jgi:hypothetical protein